MEFVLLCSFDSEKNDCLSVFNTGSDEFQTEVESRPRPHQAGQANQYPHNDHEEGNQPRTMANCFQCGGVFVIASVVITSLSIAPRGLCFQINSAVENVFVIRSLVIVCSLMICLPLFQNSSTMEILDLFALNVLWNRQVSDKTSKSFRTGFFP